MTQAAMDNDTMVAVTHEDRTAYCDYEDLDGKYRERVMSGAWDNVAGVQAFAKHRDNEARRCAAIMQRITQSGRTGAGEPVALLHENAADGEVELELYRHGAGCLTDADKAAGWTETPLYAALSQSTAGEDGA